MRNGYEMYWNIIGSGFQHCKCKAFFVDLLCWIARMTDSWQHAKVPRQHSMLFLSVVMSLQKKFRLNCFCWNSAMMFFSDLQIHNGHCRNQVDGCFGQKKLNSIFLLVGFRGCIFPITFRSVGSRMAAGRWWFGCALWEVASSWWPTSFAQGRWESTAGDLVFASLFFFNVDIIYI